MSEMTLGDDGSVEIVLDRVLAETLLEYLKSWPEMDLDEQDANAVIAALEEALGPPPPDILK